MATCIITCGKICCGKTTYCDRLVKERHAVLLSCDEITLGVMGGVHCDRHNDVLAKVERYLYTVALRILNAGTDVVLDWGLWTKAKRQYAKEFFESHSIPCEFHYLDISDAEWHRRIEKRNRDNPPDAYYVDEGLIEKVRLMFEPPTADEIDSWIFVG